MSRAFLVMMGVSDEIQQKSFAEEGASRQSGA